MWYPEVEETISLSNLFKVYNTSLNKENVRVIDSNKRIIENVSSIKVNKIEPGAPDEDGFSAGFSAEVLTALTGDGQTDTKEADLKEKQGFGEKDYEDLLAKAQEEIAQMKARAQEELAGLEEDAKEQGYAKGYEEGYQKALSEFQAKEQNLHMTEKRLKREYEEKMEEIEPKLVEVITGVYEHVFHVDLTEQSDIVTYLITNALKKADGTGNCIIHVSKEDYPYVSMEKKRIMAGGSSNTEIEIIEDITLEKNAALIETEGGIFDCGLGTQLSELNRKIRLLSYESNT